MTQRVLELTGLVRPVNTAVSTGIGDEVKRIPVHSVGPEAYKRDQAFHDQVLAHYETSLNDMVDIAEGAKARLLFVTPISNLRDFAPFKSENRADLTAGELRAWKEAYDKGLPLSRNGEWEQAAEEFRSALAIDGYHAGLLFRQGKALLALGQDREAGELFVKAREEDICPLRALSATLETMRKVANKRGIPLLDFDLLATPRAVHRIPGEDFFCDHVHMQIATSRMLARDILDRLAELRIATLAPDWGPTAISEVSRSVESTVDGSRYARELYSLSQLLDLLGQTDQGLKRVEEGLNMSHGDVDGLCLAGKYHRKLGHPQSAAEDFQKALALQPAAACAEEGLGGLLLDQGQLHSAIGHLETAMRLAPESPSVQNLLGVAHARLGHPQQALPLFRRAIERLPNDPAIHRNLALAEEQVGHSREAIVHFREALRLNPEDSQAQSGLSRLAVRNATEPSSLRRTAR
jgi:tetratricopeptide (TPR) repeat protein